MWVLLVSAGLLGWLWIGLLTVFIIWTSALDPDPHIVWLYDWHVYAAGGHDLLGGELYQSPLEFPGWPIPVDTYNLPPFSAAWTLPFLWLPDETAGIWWVSLGVLAWASAWWLTLRLTGVRLAWAWTGIALATYSAIFYWFGANVLLGNINHLVLGLLGLFVLAYVRGQPRWAGAALGLAIATKLWPVVLLVPMLRERQWALAAWALGTAAIASLLPMAWLGPEAVRPLIEALGLKVPIEPGVAVLWTTAFRETWDWWPAWGALAVGLALVAVPARGLTGIGLAVVAGISVIPNIWDHYLPTLIVATTLIGTGIWLRLRQHGAAHTHDGALVTRTAEASRLDTSPPL